MVSYKCIGINTFNVFVFDLKTRLVKYWFEGYQLWESPVKGFLLSTNDYLILSKDGTNLIALGEKPSRVVRDNEKQERMLHSLGKCNYLKIEPDNHILFAFQFYDDRQICIQHQYNDASQQTQFDDIFKIKVHEISLRELMLVQSIYAAATQSDIELLVNEQPNPTVFFKVFLELGIKCMVSYLAFDTKSTRSLLNDKNSDFFQCEYPVFYKNEDQTSAVDVALANGQIRSVNLMINYICKYQNDFVYSHLFKNNLVDLINKGVDMETLFNSNVLAFEFDFDEWPATNANTKKMLVPFNNSIFSLRMQYQTIFQDIYDADE